MNIPDKIKLTTEIASRLISSGRYLDKMGCVELAKEIIEESEKIYIHEYQSTQSTQSTQSQKEYWDKWNPYTIT